MSGGPPPSADELGPRDDFDDEPKYPKWNERSEWSLENERECEDCGQVRNMGEMVQMPNGEWYCQPCAENLPDEDEEDERDIDEEVAQIQAIEKELHPTQEFDRIGDDDACSHMETQFLRILDLDSDYEKVDALPQKLLDAIKCPECEGREFAVYGKTEDLFLGAVDLNKRELEGDDFAPEESYHYLYCNSCRSAINEALITEDLEDIKRSS